jgi:O-antigen/teichoic acid export membrane protein
MTRTRLRTHLLTLGTGMVTGRVLGFIQGVALARMLGPVELGKFATLLSVCAIISRVGDFGLSQSFAYFGRKQKDGFGSLLKVFAINTLVCCGFSAIALICVRLLPLPAFREVQVSVFWNLLLFGYLIVGTAGGMLPVFLMAAGDYRKFVFFSNSGTVLQIAMQYVMFFLSGGNLRSFFIANLVAQGAMALILFFYLLRNAGGPSAIPGATVKECYRFGLQSHWGVIMKLSSTKLEVPLIAALLPPGAVGRYSIASSFREAAFMPQQLYAGIFQNALIDKGKSGDISAGALLIKGLLFQFVLSLGISLGALLVLPFLIPRLYGADYADSVLPAVILVASSLFNGLAGLCWIGFNTGKRPQLTSLVTTVSGIISPVFIYIFASRMGLIGVGLASLAASVVTFAISLGFTIRLHRFGKANFLAALRDIKLRVLKV